ncbi:MAG: hypothetical protein HRU15_05825 [Planctomycetes bacterium]|nr:hypothetical protein [Planctomycetota bacterium]
MSESSAPLTLIEWGSLLKSATEESLEALITVDSVTVTERESFIDAQKWISFVTIINNNDAIQLGIAAEHSALTHMVQKMFCLTETDCDEDSLETLDGLAELSNIVAGAMHRHLCNDGQEVRIGIPLLLRGEIIVPSRENWTAYKMNLGDYELEAVVIRGALQASS